MGNTMDELGVRSGSVIEILGAAKKLAQRYRALTGKPLGITGEIAEFEASRLLKLDLVEARQAGYDAVRIENGVTRRLQIKGRCLLSGSRKSQRLGRIDVKKDFDGVLLVLMDEAFNALEIYEADRAPGDRGANRAGIAIEKRARCTRCQEVQVYRPTGMACARIEGRSY